MTRDGELAVVLAGVDRDRVRLERVRPEVGDLACRVVPAARRGHVHDGVPEQVGPRRGEPVRLRPREGVAAGEAGAQAERFRAGHDGALHGARVGDEGVRREARAQRFEQVDVGGGGRREHEQLDAARDFLYTRGRVVHGAVLRGGGALGGLGRPAEHRGDAGALRLPGERAADRAEADDAERGGTHGMEASGAARRRKREGRLHQEPPFVVHTVGPLKVPAGWP